jgi:hypothetical protein
MFSLLRDIFLENGANVLFSLVKGVDFFEKNLIEGGTKPLLCRT